MNVLRQHTKVEVMDPSIVKYSKIYTEDLSERLGLNDASLPNSVAFPALLNPMFGNEKLIVESGLMTEMQYERAKSRLLQKMVRILDRKIPLLVNQWGVAAISTVRMRVSSTPSSICCTQHSENTLHRR